MSRSKRHRAKSPDAPTVDHTICRADGGADEPGNYTILHRKCNNEKADGQPTGCELIWAQANGLELGGLLTVKPTISYINPLFYYGSD